MIRSLYTVNRNMNILRKKQENIGANMANINTPGYKFQEIIQSTLGTEEMVNFSGGSQLDQRQVLGRFVFGNQIDEVYRVFDQGILSETGKETDYAIIGNGFFLVELEDGEMAFTRNGNFKVDEEGSVTTMDGYRVQAPENGEEPLIVDFPNYGNLNNIGNGLFTSGNMEYTIIDGEFRQGYLEMSNVNPVDELVKMIQVTREFESNQRLLHTADETLNKAVNEIGRV